LFSGKTQPAPRGGLRLGGIGHFRGAGGAPSKNHLFRRDSGGGALKGAQQGNKGGVKGGVGIKILGNKGEASGGGRGGHQGGGVGVLGFFGRARIGKWGFDCHRWMDFLVGILIPPHRGALDAVF